MAFKVEWYSQLRLNDNFKKFTDVLLSKKDPYQKVIDNLFKSHFDCNEWNYLWNFFIEYVFKHPLTVFLKSKPYKFHKNINQGVKDILILRYKKLLMGDDVDKRMFHKDFTFHTLAFTEHNSVPKYSLLFMQEHKQDIASMLTHQHSYVERLIKQYYNMNSPIIVLRHLSRAKALRLLDYVENYTIQYILYNPTKVFNKTGLFKFNKRSNNLTNAIMRAGHAYYQNDDDKELVNKYVAYTGVHKNASK